MWAIRILSAVAHGVHLFWACRKGHDRVFGVRMSISDWSLTDCRLRCQGSATYMYTGVDDSDRYGIASGMADQENPDLHTGDIWV
mmetsp:Transcript_11407/g.17961  ORF Transcript_11407/g.17961 Transcript_11407/m.17961 type:complete len:85 (+) Transcript_11407:707-961(+)